MNEALEAFALKMHMAKSENCSSFMLSLFIYMTSSSKRRAFADAGGSATSLAVCVPDCHARESREHFLHTLLGGSNALAWSNL